MLVLVCEDDIPEGHKMSIVCRGRNRNRSGAPHVGVAQLVRQLLQLVSLEPGMAKDSTRMAMTGVCVGIDRYIG